MSFRARLGRIFLPFAVGYVVTSYFRTFTALLAPQVERDLHISTTMMSFIISLFFLAFGLMQVPAGVLNDRHGPRRTQSSLFYLAGIGSILFALAQGPTLLIIGRILSGMGLSGGLMLAFASNRTWFNNEELPMLNSLSFTFGSLGAVIAAYPTEVLLQLVPWNVLSFFLGIVLFVVATWILLVVPDPEVMMDHLTFREHFRDLKVISHDRYFWKLMPVMATSFASFIAIQSYWITPWLQHTIDANTKTISLYLLILALVTLFSAPLSSLLALLFGRFRGYIEWIIGIGITFSLIIQALIILQVWPGSFILWGGFALFSFFPLLGFTAATMHFPPAYAGRSVTALNFFAFSSSFVIQYLFGLIATSSITAAFGVIFLIQLSSLIWFCFGRTGQYANQ